MSIRLTALFLFLSIIGRIGLAAPVCEETPVQAPGLAGRATMLLFPDGRKILLIGQNHGDRELLAKALNLARQSTQMTDAQFRNEVEGILKGHDEVVRDNAADAEFLRNLSISFPSSKFVGLEVSPEALNQLKQSSFDWIRIFSTAASAKHLDRAELSKVLRTGLGATLYLKASDPEFSNKYEIIGFESKNAIDRESNAYAEFDAANSVLKSSPAYTDSVADKVGRIRYAIINAAKEGRFVRAELATELKELVPQLFDSTVRPLAERVLFAELDVNAKANDRDMAVAQSLVREGKSGVHLTGLLHWKSLVNKVKNLCRGVPLGGDPSRGSSDGQAVK